MPGLLTFSCIYLRRARAQVVEPGSHKAMRSSRRAGPDAQNRAQGTARRSKCGRPLIRHVCPAFVVSCRLRLRLRIGRRPRSGRGRRSGGGLRDGIVLRGRRDDNQRRRKVLAGGGKRRAKGYQRESGGKSNGVGLHGPAPYPRLARLATHAPPTGKNPLRSLDRHSPARVARCRADRRF